MLECGSGQLQLATKVEEAASWGGSERAPGQVSARDRASCEPRTARDRQRECHLRRRLARRLGTRAKEATAEAAEAASEAFPAVRRMGCSRPPIVARGREVRRVAHRWRRRRLAALSPPRLPASVVRARRPRSTARLPRWELVAQRTVPAEDTAREARGQSSKRARSPLSWGGGECGTGRSMGSACTLARTRMRRVGRGIWCDLRRSRCDLRWHRCHLLRPWLGLHAQHPSV